MDLKFSRGGDTFLKIFQKICRPFVVRKIFQTLAEHSKDPVLNKTFVPHLIFSNTPQNAIFGHSLDILSKKIAFFRRALPSKLVYIRAQGAF